MAAASTGTSAGSSPGPELSAISTALDDIRRRVTAIAEDSSGTDLDWVATNLFEVERSLGEASRRLGTVTAGLGKGR
jgi:hypothetical protein